MVPVSCLVLGLGAGVVAGRWGQEGRGTTEARLAAATTRAERPAATGKDRAISSSATVSDLMEMLKTGRYDVASAKLTLALDKVDPDQLAKLAGEMRENSRKNPQWDWRQNEMLSSVLAAWTDADPEAALAFAKDSPSKTFRTMAYASIFGVLAERNPEEAIRKAKDLGDGMETVNALMAACWATSRTDPREALRLFGEMKELPDHVKMSTIQELAKIAPAEAAAALGKISPMQRDNFWNSEGVFSTWAAADPDAVMAWAATATDLDLRNSALKAVCRRMAADDPEGALKKVDTMPAHLRSELIAGVMASWADRDINGAIEAASKMTKPAEREQAMAAIVNQLDFMAPKDASKVILAMPKGNARTSALEQLGYGLSWQSPSDKEAILAQFEGVERSKIASMVAGSLIAEDADAAIKMFSTIPATQRDDQSFSQFAWALSLHNPEEALKFSTTLASASERSQVVRQAISQLARLSPQDAATRMDSMTDPKDRQQALVALAETWGSNDPSAALRWAESLSGDEKTSALASLLPEQARNNPGEAAAKLQALLDNPGNASGSVLQTATGNLAKEWAGRNPDEAGAWVAGLPAGAAAEAGAAALVENWSSHDPIAAADWLATLPEGGVKDAAIQPLVESIRQNDPETAFSWGMSMKDAAKRSTVMEETIRNWNTNDPEAARAAVQQANLSSEERETYEKLLH